MKFSIVTPSFNQCHFLRETVQSIFSQAGDFEIELLVMDGGSTDGTVDFLRSINDPRLIWVSEKDKGQSDALRKGLARTTGDVVGWLNSDDLYTPGAFAAVAEALASRSDSQWAIGRCQIVNEEGSEIQKWVTAYKDRALRRYSFRALLRQNFICQMSVFWRRDFGRTFGEPDITLHHAMDYDIWLRMARQSEPVIVDKVLSQFRIHSASKTSTVFRQRFEEHYQVASRYAGDDRWSLWMNRMNVEKFVAGYRVLWLCGMMGNRRRAG